MEGERRKDAAQVEQIVAIVKEEMRAVVKVEADAAVQWRSAGAELAKIEQVVATVKTEMRAVKAEMRAVKEEMRAVVKAEVDAALRKSTEAGPAREEEVAAVATEEPPEQLTSEQLDSNYSCLLSNSTWDAAVFLWHPCIGAVLSSVTAMACLLNVAIQLGFCIVVVKYLLEPSVTNETLTDLLKFRLGVAHTMDMADKTSQQSMASQMCRRGGNNKLHVAAWQLGLHSNIELFIGTGDFWSGGLWLGILVQICWLGSCISQLTHEFSLVSALLKRPRGHTLLCNDEADGLSVSLRQISNQRIAVAVLLALLPRFLVTCFLCATGVLFLAYTEEMADLVLNAVALGFIFELDKLMFALLAPRRVKILMDKVKPIPVPKVLPGATSAVKLAILVAGLGVIVTQLSVPFHWQLGMAKEIMCGGVLDFVAVENPATDWAHVARSASDGDGPTVWTHFDKAVLQVAQVQIEDKHGWGIDDELVRISRQKEPLAVVWANHAISSQHDSVLEVEHSSEDFRTLQNLAFATVAEVSSQMSCVETEPPALKAAVELLFGIKDFNCSMITQNESLQKACGRLNMTSMRSACAVQCGCKREPLPERYTGFFDAAQFGCPEACYDYWLLDHIVEYESFTPLNFSRMPDLSDMHVVTEGETKWNWLTSYVRGLEEYMWSRASERFRLQVQLCHFLWKDSEGYEHAGLDGFCQRCYTWLDAYDVNYCPYYYGDDIDGLPLAAKERFAAAMGNASRRCIFAQEFVAYWEAGGMVTSLLDGNWKLHPAVPHPRNLTGCSFLTSWEFKGLVGVDLCSVDTHASIRQICPAECGCEQGMHDCPVTELPP